MFMCCCVILLLIIFLLFSMCSATLRLAKCWKFECSRIHDGGRPNCEKNKITITLQSCKNHVVIITAQIRTATFNSRTWKFGKKNVKLPCSDPSQAIGTRPSRYVSRLPLAVINVERCPSEMGHLHIRSTDVYCTYSFI